MGHSLVELFTVSLCFVERLPSCGLLRLFGLAVCVAAVAADGVAIVAGLAVALLHDVVTAAWPQ